MNDTPSPAGDASPASGAGSAHDDRAGDYRVLARKYRPQTFDDLIGQEPVVRTIRNGFETGRIAQAWMLTGVRGVGKTTTARILARALNYEVPGEIDQPTVDMPRPGTHCDAIMASRHVDVIEMDAASHTGIGDIREITDASRYMPASARYKVYIIDEVHMLSKQAFNGLLKTLEEPPAHVKFIFATTEIRKVPVTILSRCQRFDLRRIDRDLLVEHLAMVAERESVAAERTALVLIAQAAEGSVRDALSLLDQAIAHGAGTVRADEVAGMLGLADRSRVVDLFEATMAGRIADALGVLDALYTDGADPVVVLGDLATLSHQLTQAKIVPGSLDGVGLDTGLKARLEAMADRLAIPHLSRAWQILLKGIAEVETAPRPIAAADMVLVRLAYSADLPPPDQVLKKLRAGDGAAQDAAPAAAPGRERTPEPTAERVSHAPADRVAPPRVAHPRDNLPAMPESFEAVVALVREKRDMRLLTWLERSVRLIKFEPGRITLSPVDGASGDQANVLSQRLGEWTGRRWMVALAKEAGALTIHEQREAERNRQIAAAREAPEIAAVLERFPGAEIVGVEVLEDETDPAAAGERDVELGPQSSKSPHS